MPKCIYCLRTESETTFKNREHILPKMFGRFDELIFKGDTVCDNCNNSFSKLENEFLEDSLEGLTSATYNIVNRSHIRLRMNNLKIKVSGDFVGNVFENIFPQRGIDSKDIKPRSFLMIKNKHGGHNIFWIDRLSLINPESNRGRNIRKYIATIDKKDITVIVDSREFTSDDVRDILEKYGVNYKGNTKSYFTDCVKGNNEGGAIDWKVEESLRHNSPQVRIVAKTAFNYFAFNAFRSNSTPVLYSDKFNMIRDFITKGIGNEKWNICKPLRAPILYEERNTKGYYFGHTLTFLKMNNQILSSISFFGLKRFEIILGKYPFSIVTNHFGCGHFFSPIPGKKVIIELKSQNLLVKGNYDFGLYRR